MTLAPRPGNMRSLRDPDVGVQQPKAVRAQWQLQRAGDARRRGREASQPGCAHHEKVKESAKKHVVEIEE